jgi:hypothetical protein
MPKLKQAADGHWYILARVHAAGGKVATWQVADAGVAYAQSLGFEEELPPWLFSELLEGGLAFTMGSGLSDQPPLDLLPAKGADKQLKLAAAETEQGWILQLLIPELPTAVVAPLVRSGNRTLAKCGFQIDGDKTLLTASQLWPGKGGKAWPVDPHERPYSVIPVGPWPPEASLDHLSHPVDGLEPVGSVFFSSDNLGGRVPRGKVVVSDSFYVFVVGPKYARHFDPPRSLSPRSLGTNNGWNAWELRFPQEADDSVKRWCAQFGLGIEQPKLVLDVVTPPPKRMLVTGVPVFEVRDRIVVSATATSERVALQGFGFQILCDGVAQHQISKLRNASAGEDLYLQFPVDRPGTYQIRALKGRVAPLTFVATPRSSPPTREKLGRKPAPLTVRLDEQVYIAFGTLGEEEWIAAWLRKSDKPPVLEIRCPASLRVTWKLDGRSEHRLLSSAEATDLFQQQLLCILAERKPLTIELDAGSFGRLRLRVAPEGLRLPSLGAQADLAPQTLERARWLSATVAALARQMVPEVALDSQSKSAFRKLGAYPGCQNLRAMDKVPAALLHHAIALGRLTSKKAMTEVRSLDARPR